MQQRPERQSAESFPLRNPLRPAKDMAIVAGDSSDNTKKKFRNMCEFYEVPLYILSDKETLGHAMGKEFRASLAVQDWNFAEAIMKVLQDEGKEL